MRLPAWCSWDLSCPQDKRQYVIPPCTREPRLTRAHWGPLTSHTKPDLYLPNPPRIIVPLREADMVAGTGETLMHIYWMDKNRDFCTHGFSTGIPELLTDWDVLGSSCKMPDTQACPQHKDHFQKPECSPVSSALHTGPQLRCKFHSKRRKKERVAISQRVCRFVPVCRRIGSIQHCCSTCWWKTPSFQTLLSKVLYNHLKAASPCPRKVLKVDKLEEIAFEREHVFISLELKERGDKTQNQPVSKNSKE